MLRSHVYPGPVFMFRCTCTRCKRSALTYSKSSFRRLNDPVRFFSLPTRNENASSLLYALYIGEPRRAMQPTAPEPFCHYFLLKSPRQRGSYIDLARRLNDSCRLWVQASAFCTAYTYVHRFTQVPNIPTRRAKQSAAVKILPRTCGERAAAVIIPLSTAASSTFTLVCPSLSFRVPG